MLLYYWIVVENNSNLYIELYKNVIIILDCG